MQAVDQLDRMDSRLDKIGDGWARDAAGWFEFRSGIHPDASPAKLEPLRTAAMNMAAQMAGLSR